MAMSSLMAAATTVSVWSASGAPACHCTECISLSFPSASCPGWSSAKIHISAASPQFARGATGIDVRLSVSQGTIQRDVRVGIAYGGLPAVLGEHGPCLQLSRSHVGITSCRRGSATLLPSRTLPRVGPKSKQRSRSHSSPRTGKLLSCTAGIAMSREEESQSLKVSEADLLVVGPGVLGSLVAQLWLKGNEGATVVGQTNTTARHEDLKAAGIVPVVKDGPHNTEKFPYVIFCAPPSGSSDYAAEVREAAQRWNGEGSLLFTSSSALYDVSDNGICDEESGASIPEGKGPRTDKLLRAESEILKVGGNVVRFAGLYLLNRGAHTFYLSKGTVDIRPDHIVNFIHYEDAASLCLALLKADSRGRLYMGCDNSPISRQVLMDSVNKSGKFEGKFEGFTGLDGPLGKQMDNSSTRKATGWKPKYESFPSFLGV